MVAFLLALAALVIGLCLLFGIALGSLTPHLVAVAVICLALAVLFQPTLDFIRRKPTP